MDGSGQEWLLQLYDRSHGVERERVSYAHLGSTPEERLAQWSATLRALGWEIGEPKGSSRLLELLVFQAVRDNDLVIVLREAFAQLGRYEGPLKFGMEWQARLLWVAARAAGQVGPGMPPLRLWLDLSERLTPSQAILAAVFATPHTPQAEVEAIRRTLQGQTVRFTY